MLLELFDHIIQRTNNITRLRPRLRRIIKHLDPNHLRLLSNPIRLPRNRPRNVRAMPVQILIANLHPSSNSDKLWAL